MFERAYGAPQHSNNLDHRTAAPESLSQAERESKLLGALPRLDAHILADLSDAVDMGDTERVIELVRDRWFDLLRGNSSDLLDVMGRVPSETIRDSPLLAMIAGLLFYGTPHRRVKGLRLFVGAIRAAGSDKRILEPLDRALILTSASVSYRLIGRAALGVKPARTALRILNGMPDADRQRVHVLPRLYSQLGVTLYRAGQTDEALTAFEYGLAEVPRPGYPHGFMNIAMLAGIHALQGNLKESATHLASARAPEWSDASRSMYPGTYYRIAEAIASIEHFDATTARHHLEALVHDRATIEHWIPIVLTEALTDLIDGRPGVALAGIDAFAASRGKEGRSTTAKNQLAPARALLQLALRNPDAAVMILDRDAAPGAEREVARARTDLALGNHGSALRRLRRLAGVRLTMRLSAEAATLEVACLLRISDRPGIRPALEHLGATLTASGLRVPLALLPNSDFARVRSALSDAGYSDLLVGLPATVIIPDPDDERLLSERELAVLQALVNTASNAAIARELVVSVNTVKTQLRSIYRKLEVSNREEAIAVALARNLATVRRRHNDRDDRRDSTHLAFAGRE